MTPPKRNEMKALSLNRARAKCATWSAGDMTPPYETLNNNLPIRVLFDFLSVEHGFDEGALPVAEGEQEDGGILPQ